MSVRKIANRNAGGFIANQLDYIGSNYQGDNVDNASQSYAVPDEYRELYRRDMANGGYHVWSYATIIGWTNDLDGWVIPRITYSNTTSRHQWTLRRAAHRYDERPADEILIEREVRDLISQGYPADAAAAYVALQRLNATPIPVP